jgi:hypothetical protein
MASSRARSGAGFSPALVMPMPSVHAISAAAVTRAVFDSVDV